MRTPQILRPVVHPAPATLKSATRAAIVIPSVFAFADKVIAEPQTTLFSAFGSFALLVLADFRGPPRSRLAAYVTLGAAGAALIALGTLCSRTSLGAAIATAVVGFAILAAGVTNPYVAAGTFAALLSFIISVNIPAPLSTVPARLEGWGLACAGAIPALMLLWPPRPTQQDRDVMLHASPAFSSDGPRSIPLRDSLRAAVALAIAVFVAQRLSVQHAFWVVLGTLSVLRSTALGTASSVWRALIGTSVGIVIGVGLILLIGTDESALWPVLPFAVLLAAYAPRAISFAAGQAGFTVVLLILFDLIEPAGWTVGLIRIEDVVIGFTISLAVGLLCWPRFAARPHAQG